MGKKSVLKKKSVPKYGNECYDSYSIDERERVSIGFLQNWEKYK
jgi:hypothetical protein